MMLDSSRSFDKQFSEIIIAAFAGAEQLLPVAGGVLLPRIVSCNSGWRSQILTPQLPAPLHGLEQVSDAKVLDGIHENPHHEPNPKAGEIEYARRTSCTRRGWLYERPV
jgi:hypothetical protein